MVDKRSKTKPEPSVSGLPSTVVGADQVFGHRKLTASRRQPNYKSILSQSWLKTARHPSIEKSYDTDELGSCSIGRENIGSHISHVEDIVIFACGEVDGIGTMDRQSDPALHGNYSAYYYLPADRPKVVQKFAI